MTPLKDRQPAQTTFEGYGLFDVFARGRRLVGTVALDMAAPPFVLGDGDEFKFAPEHFIFAHGLVETSQPVIVASTKS